jgi:hypothetical protein
VVAAIDRQPSHAGGAHLAEGNLLGVVHFEQAFIENEAKTHCAGLLCRGKPLLLAVIAAPAEGISALKMQEMPESERW